MEPTQQAVASPEAMGVPRGQACPQEVVPVEEIVHPPQSVGREFVRQYYTMLHQAPEQLHRFYSQNSRFLHERWDNCKAEDKPAIGQIEIYERIKTMNFRDCHAKIFQVDSQLSVCHTVVVQVLGELSNNGEPLRKFMQTFVLVPQTNKKYYVHNDIFRYQDDEGVPFGHDPESEYNNGVEEEEELDSVQPGHVAAAVEQTSEVLYVQQVEERVVPEERESAIEVEREDEAEDLEDHGSAPVAAPPAPEGVEGDLPEEEEEGEEKHRDGEVSSGNLPVEARDASLPPQKLSWAEMASRNVGSSFRPLPFKADQRNGTSTSVNARSTPPPSAARSSPTPPQQQQQQQQHSSQKPVNHREQHHQHQSTEEGPNSNNNILVPGRGMQFYPDQQQIFVGNLPHHMSDQDLKEFFEKYGKVLDIRINRKPNNSLPNFGFIAFDSAETVKHILGLRPLYYNGKFRVNVEEKKRREDLIGSRPRSGNVTSPSVGQAANQSPDRGGVANGNVAPPLQREEGQKVVNQQGSAAC